MNATRDANANAARADRVTAIVLFALGVAMLAGGFFMERLEIRRIHPASIPGLVPMLLGATLALCSIALYRSAGAGADAAGASVDPDVDTDDVGPEAGADDAAAPGDVPERGTPGCVPSERDAAGVHESESWTRLGAAALWSVFYALVLVGRLPFAVATALYIVVFVAGFGWSGAHGARASLVAKALLLGSVAAWAIATLFSEGFLVRLP